MFFSPLAYRTRNNGRCTLCATSSHIQSCHSCTCVEKDENEQKCSISCQCQTVEGVFQTTNTTWYNNCELQNFNGELKCTTNPENRCYEKPIMNNLRMLSPKRENVYI